MKKKSAVDTEPGFVGPWSGSVTCDPKKAHDPCACGHPRHEHCEVGCLTHACGCGQFLRQDVKRRF